MKLIDIHIKPILDSRSNPTLEAVLTTEGGAFEASVPAGKSTGAHEAAVIDPQEAPEKLKVIKDRLLSTEAGTQSEFDEMLIDLDGTSNKSRLGANVILALSVAWARAYAHETKKELYISLRDELSLKGVKIEDRHPYPIFNVINGGAHVHIPEEWNKKGRGALDFQEFQIIPETRDFALALSLGAEFYRKLKAALEKKFGKENVLMGDEAGFFAPFASNEEALEIMHELIESQRYPIKIGLDIAATQLYKDSMYMVDGNPLSAQELMEKYGRLIHAFPIISIEDPFHEEDFQSFAQFTAQTNADATQTDVNERGTHVSSQHTSVLVITDDLTTTNHDRLQQAINTKSGNCILVKPNQIGSVSETLDVIALAHANGWEQVISHRSGETMDDFIGDLAVAAGAWGIKAGAPGRPERIVKYNRILDIVQNRK